MMFVAPKPGLVTPQGFKPAIVPEKVIFSEEEEARQMAYTALGDLDDIEILFNEVLLLKYIRMHLSANLVAHADTQLEDKWQGGVGLVLKVGPTAFVDDEHTKFNNVTVKRGDWVSWRVSDGWARGVQELYGHHRFADCILVQDAHIRLRLKYPGRLMALGS
jgi:hypothetical protein